MNPKTIPLLGSELVKEVDLKESSFVTLNSVVAGWSFGGDIKISVGPGHLIVDLRYSLDFSDNIESKEVFTAWGDTETEETESKGRVFSALIGYGFSF